MKFGKEVEVLAIPEWKTKYIQYEELKDLIDTLVAEGAASEPFDAAECPFIKALSEQVHKVDLFYKEEEKKLLRGWDAIYATLEAIEAREGEADGGGRPAALCVPASTPKKLTTVRESVEEFYLTVDKLTSYKMLNLMAIRKIMKKYDKNLRRSVSSDYVARFSESHCFRSNALAQLEEKIVNAYTIYFTSGSRRDAMRRLRVPAQRFTPLPWLLFATGVMLGVALMCVGVLAVAVAYEDRTDVPRSRTVALFRVFRGLFVISVFPLLLAANFYVFAKTGVNFRLMMRISQRDKRSFRLWETLLGIGAFSFAAWGIATVVFVFSPLVQGDSVAWAPVATLLCIALACVRPIHVMRNREAPRSLRLLGRVMLAPVFEVEFTDFWAADQMCSLVRPMLDVEFAVFYFLYAYESGGESAFEMSIGHVIGRGLLACLPYSWRALQCVRRYRDQRIRNFHPHLTNMFKYISTFFVIWFSILASHFRGSGVDLDTPASRGFFALWVVASVVNMAYTMTWDFTMDWGIMRRRGELLRPKLLFPRPYYYAAIVGNILGRTAWVLSVSVGFFNDFRYNYLDLALACVEITRRFSWNFFRFEIEHLFNCGKLRATNVEVFRHPSVSSRGEATGGGSLSESQQSESDRIDAPFFAELAFPISAMDDGDALAAYSESIL